MTVAQLNRLDYHLDSIPSELADATFSLRVDLRVKDIIALWMEALHVGLGQNASKMTDVTRVIDVIGTQAAPSIADCIAMLADPSRFPGCRVSRIDLVEQHDATTNRARPHLV